jgi:hypothetical protein
VWSSPPNRCELISRQTRPICSQRSSCEGTAAEEMRRSPAERNFQMHYWRY